MTEHLDYAVYYSRLANVFDDVMACYKTEQWEEYMMERAPEEWCLAIAKYTLPDFKDLLNQAEPPAWWQILSLPWTESEMAGKLSGSPCCSHST